MSRPPTLHDVAARVGVSARTVSRVVNREDVVSPATRERVLEAIELLGYRPNLLARGLINRRSGMIALMVPSMANPFFPEFGDAVASAAREHGLTLVLTSSEDDAAIQRRLIGDLASHAVEGLIAFGASGGGQSLHAAAADGLPTVVVNDPATGPNLISVRADMARGARLAAGHLAATGRTTPAMIARRLEDAHPHWRENGFTTACADLEMASIVVEGDADTIEGGRKATETLLRRHPDIDGIFAYNDLMAIGALAACRAAGRTVPDDIAIVGFDDIAMASMVSPALTTVRIDRHQLGQLAVETLVASRHARAEPPPLDVELIVRDST